MEVAAPVHCYGRVSLAMVVVVVVMVVVMVIIPARSKG